MEIDSASNDVYSMGQEMVHVLFNWCWHHVPTFAPYKFEGVFHHIILAHGGTSQSVKTASIVSGIIQGLNCH